MGNLLLRQGGRYGVRVAGAVLAGVAVAGLCIWQMARWTDRQMRAELLAQARLARQSVDIRLFKSLSGSGEDIDKPEYQQLKNQLADFRQADFRCRFLYVLGHRPLSAGTGKQIFFYADSERAGSEAYSPPGQVYSEADAGCRHVFETRTAAVVGPMKDRWGTWTSAFVPLNDPVTGLLVAVLGMDIDARDWRWDVAARTALPAGLLVALLIVLGAVALSNRPLRRQQGIKPIGKRLLVPLTAALLALSAGAVMLLVKQQRESVNHLLRAVRLGATTELVSLMEAQVQSLHTMGAVLLENPKIARGLASRDCAVLDEIAGRVFKTLRQECRITSLAFWSPDRHCLARAQRLGNGAEQFDARLFQEADRTRRPAAGLERRAFGFLELRAIRPVYDDGNALCGYVEIDKEIEDVLDALNRQVGLEFAIIVPKKAVSRDGWETVMRACGRPAEWDRFKDSVFIFSTLPVLSRKLGHDAGAWDADLSPVMMQIVNGGQTWRVTSFPLRDVDSAELGRLILLLNVTDVQTVQTRLRAIGLCGGLVLLAALFGFLYVLLRRTDSRIRLQQAQLQRSEQRLSATLRSIGDGVITTNAAGRVVDLNLVAERLTGWTTPDAAGHSVSEVFRIVNAKTRLAVADPVEEALRTQHVVELGNNTLLLARDGAEHQIADSCAPIRDAGGGILGAVLVFRDVTEAYRRREALRNSEIRLRAITDAARDAILMVDSGGKTSFWNPAAERLFGYTAQEALGRSLHLLIMPNRYWKRFMAGWTRFRETGHGNAVNATLELEARHKSGEEVPVELSLSAVQVEGRWHAVGIMRDIRERRRAQDDLVEANRRLQEATERANAMAGEARMASTAKSEFLANMSHEIRTPMNGVIGMTGLLLDTELTEEQRRYAETVRTSAESLLGLINDILDFSKIEAGKLALEELDFDLQELVADLAATMALRAQDKGLELLYSIATEVPSLLRGDPGRLRQILMNLLSNAVKFTSVGEVAIRVTLESENRDSALLRFSVRDTGIGIPENKRGLLFEKFSQADASTTRKYGGTGLGLAICKQLAELMGGSVSVVSEEGKGSEFSVTARFAKQAVGARPVVNEPVDLRHVRVLIVDDNATSREILSTYMSSWGMRPVETADGPSAIQLLVRAQEANDPFPLAVLDMQMPVMDGEMLGKAIKADPRIAGTRLVMLTSLGARENVTHFREIGFAACLTKPTRHQELRRALSAALSDSRPEPAPAAGQGRTSRGLQDVFAGVAARILLAEDNITNQQVALGILKKLGLRADAVANGAEALKALATVPYDLVLMDVQMPVMDGLEATAQIRGRKAGVLNPDVVVVAMTAHAMRGDQEQCLTAGMNDYVSKPVSPQALVRVLEKWIGKTTAARNGCETAAPKTAAAQDPALPVWDLDGLMERVMGDRDLAQKILAGFPEDVAQRLQAVKALFEAGDAAGAERQLHTINGASGIVGGEALRAEAFAMEKAARVGDLSGAAARYSELVRRFELLKSAIENQLTAWRA